MRRRGHTGKLKRDGGQSLIETAIFLPILILLVAYAVDFGYFFIVAANLTSASRNAAEYSIQGFASPAQSALPIAGPITTNTSVAALAVGDLSSLAASSSTTSVEVCSKILGTTNNVTNCSSYGPAGPSLLRRRIRRHRPFSCSAWMSPTRCSLQFLSAFFRILCCRR